jgi:hypothetical protein
VVGTGSDNRLWSLICVTFFKFFSLWGAWFDWIFVFYPLQHLDGYGFFSLLGEVMVSDSREAALADIEGQLTYVSQFLL